MAHLGLALILKATNESIAAEQSFRELEGEKARELFKERCVRCHGTRGDGRGILASYLSPRPLLPLLVSLLSFSFSSTGFVSPRGNCHSGRLGRGFFVKKVASTKGGSKKKPASSGGGFGLKKAGPPPETKVGADALTKLKNSMRSEWASASMQRIQYKLGAVTLSTEEHELIRSCGSVKQFLTRLQLVPFGSTNIRIAVFPWASKGEVTLCGTVRDLDGCVVGFARAR